MISGTDTGSIQNLRITWFGGDSYVSFVLPKTGQSWEISCHLDSEKNKLF